VKKSLEIYRDRRLFKEKKIKTKPLRRNIFLDTLAFDKFSTSKRNNTALFFSSCSFPKPIDATKPNRATPIKSKTDKSI
jgi:hypothetical protein